jgi:hypothetical protein
MARRVMKLRRIPLGVLGLAGWTALTWVTVNLLPANPGPYSERPFAKAVLLGAVVGIPLMSVDLVRHPRRVWLWGLLAWSVILSMSAWSGASGEDSDIVQILGWGFMLGGLVGIPLIIGSTVAWIWRRTARSIKNRPRRWRALVHDNVVEVIRTKDPRDSAD